MKNKWLLLVWPLLLIFFFVGLRLFKINFTLEFFGDVARDLHVISLAIIEKKVPLLGPGISFLPLNQSPIYYFLLMPVFVLSGWSVYTAMVTFNLIYILFFVSGVYILRNNHKLLKVLLLMGTLVTFHPEFVYQLRNPWNPSLAPPFLFLSLFALILLNKKFTNFRAIVFAFSLAMAIGLTVSIVPTALVLVFYALFIFRKSLHKNLKLFFFFCSSLIVVFLPVIVFEIRHGFFFLSRLMMDDPYLSKPSIDYMQKLIDLSGYLTGTYSLYITILAILVLLTLFALNIFSIKNEENRNNQDKLFVTFLSLFIISFLVTFAMPFILHSHYIFGPLSLLLISISLMRKKFVLMGLFMFGMLWLNPVRVKSYFPTPQRSVSKLSTCMQQACENVSEPVYVTAQAWHEYHSALDYIFLMNKFGCQARNIIQNPGWADKMLVVVDNSEYQHGKTSFNELTSFGEATESAQIKCSDELQVHVLEQLK